MKKKRLVVVDSMAYAFRSFYAVPEMSNSAGQPTNAVYGFLGALRRAERTFKPDYAVVASDSPGGSFRDEMLKEYKAHREAPPEGLLSQFPLIEELAGLSGWHVLRKARFEADDIMATLTAWGRKAGLEVILMTSDKDMLQLVGGDVKVYRENPKGASLYGPDEVKERYGIGPECITDLLGLMGDSSDNIPGVPGIGEKTAAKLLQEYGSMEKVLKAAKGMKPGKLRENLIEFAEQARLSQKLAELDADVALGKSLQDLFKVEPDYARLLPRLKELELRTLHGELTQQAAKAGLTPEVLAPAAVAALPGKKGAAAKVVKEALKAQGFASCQLLAAGLSRAGFKAGELLGLVLHPFEALPRSLPAKLVLAQGKRAVHADIEGWKALRAALAKAGPLACFESKSLQRALLAQGLEPLPEVFDLSIGFYLFNSVRQPRDLAEAGILLGSAVEVPAVQEGLFEPPLDQLCALAAATAALGSELTTRLKKEGLGKLYDELEGPLIPVLAKMERDGIMIDVAALEELDTEAQKGMKRLQAKAVKAAGRDFNVNSPSQLADVLFKELKLKTGKKTKTGFSTDNEVLEGLAGEHELPAMILEYRQLAKLSGTYLQALPRLVDPADGRVHGHWNQNVAATGRLSSTDPNLQNIPIRTDLGREIRRAFVTEKRGDLILAADYSQIELRILAHYAQDKLLIEAFEQDRDIHTETASRIFSVAAEKVTPEMRSRAKVINFGVLYGMGPFRISREFGVPMAEAKSFIESYFSQFPKVAATLERFKDETRRDGFALTLMGRRRPIPEIRSANRVLREQGERVATNLPIQGSAADLIKKAMLDLDAALQKKKSRSRLLMQVHDELVLEMAKEDVDWLPKTVKETMEKAIKLRVPLKVELGQGRSWYHAKG